MTGLWIVLAALVVALAFGTYRRLGDGRLRSASGDRLDAAALGAPLGSTATLVQFSSATCAPCVPTRRVLGEVSAAREGVSHVDLDAADRLDLVERFDVTRTPTVLLLDGSGSVRHRIVGAPRRDDVVAALQSLSAA